jgi:hypothetical protein
MHECVAVIVAVALVLVGKLVVDPVFQLRLVRVYPRAGSATDATEPGRRHGRDPDRPIHLPASAADRCAARLVLGGTSNGNDAVLTGFGGCRKTTAERNPTARRRLEGARMFVMCGNQSSGTARMPGEGVPNVQSVALALASAEDRMDRSALP